MSKQINFVIETKGIKYKVKKENHFEAIKDFFKRIKSEDIPLQKIGMICFCYSKEMENSPFRTVPALYKMGIIDAVCAMENMKQINPLFTKTDLELLAVKDEWMIK